MSSQSAIEWTDATWNPVRGCTKVSPGCKHCYAETLAERFRGVTGHAYEQGFDLRLVPEKVGEPQRWKAPKRIFVNSMSDLFHEQVPDDYIAEVWKTMATIRRHTYQVLTKRADRLKTLMPRLVATFGVLPNVWVGVSVESQPYLWRIDRLKDVDAAVRFVSFEPLLEDIGAVLLDGIQWIIVGGESGAGAHGCALEWIAALVAQAGAQGVARFVKQLGAVPMEAEARWRGRAVTRLLSARNRHRVPEGFVPLAFNARKGGDIDEWPAELRVREFPRVACTA